jgi:hypothetical protein
VASATGALLGPFGVLLSAESMGTILLVAGILFLSQERWLTFGLAAALTIALVLITGSLWRHGTRGTGGRTAGTDQNAARSELNWPRQAISPALAEKADLRGADLDGADLNGVQLSHKNLDGAQANGASLAGSQLQDASLRGVSLRGACLAGADLTGADLTGADLAGADFSGADVAGVIVTPQAIAAAVAWPTAASRLAVACG